jgi:hypothetical protein
MPSFPSQINQLSRTKIPPPVILSFLKNCINSQWTVQTFNTNLKNWKTDEQLYKYLCDWSSQFVVDQSLQKKFKADMILFKQGLKKIISEEDISLMKLHLAHPIYLPVTRLNRFRALLITGKKMISFKEFCKTQTDTLIWWVEFCQRIGALTGATGLNPVTQIVDNIILVSNEFYAVNIGNIFEKTCYTHISNIWNKTQYKDTPLHFGKSYLKFNSNNKFIK